MPRMAYVMCGMDFDCISRQDNSRSQPFEFEWPHAACSRTDAGTRLRKSRLHLCAAGPFRIRSRIESADIATAENPDVNPWRGGTPVCRRPAPRLNILCCLR